MTRVTRSHMKTPSSDDKTVESAPSGSVKMIKVEANATDKLKEGADKIEETKHGFDEVEKGAENQGETTDNNKSDEEDEEEEAEEDEEEEAEEDEEEEAEEDKEEDAKESEVVEAVTEFVTEEKVNEEIDGEVEPLAADVIAGSENTKTGKEEEGGVKDSATEKNMPRKKAKRKTTTKATVSKEAVKVGEKVVTEFTAEEKGIKENDEPLKSMPVCLLPKSGIPEVGNEKEEKEVIDSTAREIMPIKKAKRARKKTTANATASKEADKSDELLNADKEEASAALKKVKMADGMGLIFMCNTKTKQDCFRFKVLGLPASKKELVTKIYKGMRLFLFDADLKLMYGIFKAVTPGAYHIEPKAFNGAYPAQVRFTVFHDCLPLPEEKFKVALKENYYGRNQFDNKLSQEQVKKLCRLFQNASKTAKKKRSRAETTEPLTAPPSKRREWTRTNNAIRSARAESIRARDVRKAREPIHPPSRSHRSTPHGGSSRRTPPPSRRRERSAAPRRREAYVESGRPQDLDMYPRRREAYASPPRRAFAAPAPSALPYDYYYREDPLSAPPYPSMVDPMERRVRDLEMRQPLTRGSHVEEYRGDEYNVYREARGLYPDSYYGPGSGSGSGSGSGLYAAQPVYAPVAQTAAYAPQTQAAYSLAAQAAYGSHPLYYHY